MIDSLLWIATTCLSGGTEPRPFPAFQIAIAAGSDGVVILDQDFAPVNISFEVTEARDVVFSADGLLWVSDVDVLKQFDADGDVIQSISTPSGMSSFRGIGISPFGEIMVCDETNDRLISFDPHTELAMPYEIPLSDVDGPVDIAFTSTGTYYVVADGSDELVEFDWVGREIQSESIVDPSCIEITCNGIALVTRPGAGKLDMVEGISFDVLDEVDVSNANAIALAPRGELLIADPASEGLHRLDLATGDYASKGFVDLSGYTEISGVAVAPQRFSVKGKARTLLEGQVTQQKVEGIWCVRAFAGQSSLELAFGADGPAATFFRYPTGLAGISTKNGDRYQFLGSVLGAGGNSGVHSHLAFLAKGKVDEEGFFRVKSASGTLHESVSNSIMTIELETKNELK